MIYTRVIYSSSSSTFESFINQSITKNKDSRVLDIKLSTLNLSVLLLVAVIIYEKDD